MPDQQYWLYIMANRPGGTLYVGTTSDLIRRVDQHKRGRGASFVKKYNLTALVYFEPHDGYVAAREREIRLKKWRRAWKNELIERANPDWRDLSDDLTA